MKAQTVDLSQVLASVPGYARRAVRRFAAGALAASLVLGGGPGKAGAMSLSELVKTVATGAGAMLADRSSSDAEVGLIVLGTSLGVEVLEAGIKGKPLTREDLTNALSRGIAAGALAMTAERGSSDLDRAARALLGAGAYEVGRELARGDRYYARRGSRARVEVLAQGASYLTTPRTECRKVHVRRYENGRLVEDRVKEVCESHKVEARYEGDVPGPDFPNP